MDEKEAREILMKEYQLAGQQYTRWDDCFWAKSMFFLSAEGVALLTTSGWLAALKKPVPAWPFAVLLVMFVALNFFLCCVWLSTGMRNHIYLTLRRKRALEIEEHPLLRYEQAEVSRPLLQTVQQQDEKLRSLKRASFPQEQIPIAFAMAWCLLLLTALWILFWS